MSDTNVQSLQEYIVALEAENRALRESRAELEEKYHTVNQALQESERHQTQMLETMADGMVMVDVEGQIVYANRAAEEILELSRDNILQRRYQERNWRQVDLQGNPLPSEKLPLALALKELRQVEGMEHGIVREDGGVKWLSVNAAPLMGTTGWIHGAVASFREITKQKQAEKDLQDSQERYRLLLDTLEEGIWVIDKDGFTSFVNPSMAEMLGYTYQEMLGKTVFDFMDEESQSLAHKKLERCESGIKEQYEFVLQKKDGSYIYALLGAAPIKNSDGSYEGSIASVVDISSRRQAEEERLHLAEEFKHTVQNLQNLVYRARRDEQGNPVFVFSEGLLAVDLGISTQHIAGKTLTEVFGPRDGRFLQIYFKRAFTGERISFDTHYQDRYFTITAVPVEKDGTIEIVTGSAVEITQRKRMEEALRQSENRFRQVFENSGFGIILGDLNGNVFDVNSAFAEIVGYERQDLLDPARKNITHPDDKAYEDELFQEIREGLRSGYEMEKRYYHKDGHIVWGHIMVTLSEDSTRDTELAICIVEDISERRRAAEQLQERLAEREVLLREIHHRVKNNLQIISSLLGLQTDYLEDPLALHLLKDSQERVYTMSLVHEKLYQSPNLALVQFGDYLKDLVYYLYCSYSAEQSVNLQIEADDILLEIGDAIPCGLIVNELVTNAFKYAFTDRPPADRQEDCNLIIRFNRTATDKSYCLEISDNGVGLPNDLDFRNPLSLGLQLVNILAKQLEANLTLERTSGTCWQLTFGEQNK